MNLQKTYISALISEDNGEQSANEDVQYNIYYVYRSGEVNNIGTFDTQDEAHQSLGDSFYIEDDKNIKRQIIRSLSREVDNVDVNTSPIYSGLIGAHIVYAVIVGS